MSDLHPHVWPGLDAVEQLLGNERKITIGQGVNAIAFNKGIPVPQAELKRRAVVLAWVVDPAIFGGRSLPEVLKEVVS